MKFTYINHEVIAVSDELEISLVYPSDYVLELMTDGKNKVGETEYILRKNRSGSNDIRFGSRREAMSYILGCYHARGVNVNVNAWKHPEIMGANDRKKFHQAVISAISTHTENAIEVQLGKQRQHPVGAVIIVG